MSFDSGGDDKGEEDDSKILIDHIRKQFPLLVRSGAIPNILLSM